MEENQPEVEEDWRRTNRSSSFAGGGLLVQTYTLIGPLGLTEDGPLERV
jgi:hypothetical protein